MTQNDHKSTFGVNLDSISSISIAQEFAGNPIEGHCGGGEYPNFDQK
jgi:hypothetical protein